MDRLVTGMVADEPLPEDVIHGDPALHQRQLADHKLMFETAIARRDAEIRRYRAEIECLRIIKQRFEAIVDNVPCFLYAIDRNGKITFVSKSFSTFTGRPESDALGDGWMNFVHPDDVASVREALMHAIQTGISKGVPFRIRSASGRYGRFYGVGSPVRDANGKLIEWYGSLSTVDVAETLAASAGA